jgi:tetraacyldisaccharide 4'-kinase
LIRERLRGRLEGWLLRVWFGPASPADRLLAALAAPVALPLSWLVGAIARRRRRRIERLLPGASTVPVVVVGNLVAGGSGKTPLVVAIARALVDAGFHPGLLAGGYRAAATAGGGVTMIDGATAAGASRGDAAWVGDEAALLALETGLPLAVARNRAAAAACLRRLHPECDVIISDDGLQQVGLARQIELLVIDDRGLGNGRCLPAGPLREPADRIDTVDAVILTGAQAAAPRRPARQFRSGLTLQRFRSLDGAGQWQPGEFARRFAAEPMSAIAGIARPQRFFASLQALGLQPQCHPLPDHARIDPAWLAALPGRWILMTGKDAVKCRGFEANLLARCVQLDVAATPDAALLKWLAAQLRSAAHRIG